MFGRLKLALVALVLMPAVAFAADHSPRHAPGVAASTVADAKMAAPASDAGETSSKHRPSTKAAPSGPSTMATFLAGLGDVEAASAPSSRAKHAAPLPAANAPARSGGHRAG
ncbi:MAG: hypothetical protein KIT43_04460 [Bauldia sp.]|nr:hypothetical protein [Bauldia sp.]MCW5717936.1 hypothetical protein [Bauldia sp.]